MKNRGEEPTYPRLVACNPKALMNTETDEPVDKKVVYNILRSHCYDDPSDPSDGWTHQERLAQNALTEKMVEDRYHWALDMQKKRHSVQYSFRTLVWTDICNTILPRTKKRHEEMVLARKGKKGWGGS